MSQTMLLTKRLTTFLSQNTTSQLPTLLLLSPIGRLLSSSSPLSASTLRTQATLACSIWNLYQPSASSLMTSALPRTPTQADTRNHPRASESTISSTTTAAENDLSIITIQLSEGVMVIRALACGLLFVAIGPTASGSSAQLSPHLLQAHRANISIQTTPASSPPTRSDDATREAFGGGLLGLESGAPSRAPSEAGSNDSTRTRSSIMGARRQAEEVAKWLDSQLEGFVLSSGEGR